MTAQAVSTADDLQHAFGALHQALEGRDASAILSATRAIRGAVDALRSVGAEQMTPELRARLEALAPEIDAARVQVNVAADTVRQRMSGLAQKGVQAAAPMTYGR